MYIIDKQPSESVWCDFDARFQNPRYLEMTFEEVWGTERDDNNDYDSYFPLDEND
jgi:hypothetical protein